MSSEMRKVDPPSRSKASCLPCLQVIFNMAAENKTVSQAVNETLEQIKKMLLKIFQR